jgi:hypothetical protein
VADKRPLHILSMAGLGDSIYQRCFVRQLAEKWEVYLANPWPQLYADIEGLKYVKRHPLRLRVQTKNIRRLPESTWSEPPDPIRSRILGYNLLQPQDNIITGLERVVSLDGPLVFDLPDMGPSPLRHSKPIAVIRPASVRGEWRNEARNPDPRYLVEAGRILMEQGFHVVSVADLQRGIENGLTPLPPAHETYHKGEFDVRQIMALVRDAAVVVGAIGWVLPASLALSTPCIMVGGGHGWYNREERLVDPRMDTSRVRWLMPSPFCKCNNMIHACPKRIPRFRERFTEALAEITNVRTRAAA